MIGISIGLYVGSNLDYIYKRVSKNSKTIDVGVYYYFDNGYVVDTDEMYREFETKMEKLYINKINENRKALN